MKLIVGLGNPGPDYRSTRHNVGFEVVDAVAARLGHNDGVLRSRFSALLAEVDIAGEKVLLAKPLTFMNRSGQSVIAAIQFYKLDPEVDLLVIADDLDLPCGHIRLREVGGDGGHNGLSDISLVLGHNRWARCRVGIGNSEVIPKVDYVLGRFTPEQQPMVAAAIQVAADAVSVWCQRGTTAAMNQFNKKVESNNGPSTSSSPKLEN
ncbi:MAG: aminoacyl-tRNA hydrolase [Planctomycetota bacterium]|nr:aminoacyl-tRNA hydrolase [Planctomycetota bacterium]